MGSEGTMSKQSIGPCPEKCGGEVTDTGTFFQCSKRRRSKANPVGCRFELWRNALTGFGKSKISPEEMAEMVAGRDIRLELKAGIRYGALERAPGGGWWVGLYWRPLHQVQVDPPVRAKRGVVDINCCEK